MPAGSPARAGGKRRSFSVGPTSGPSLQTPKSFGGQSKAYPSPYEKILGVVDQYAKAHDLTVVVNYSGPDQPDKPADVARKVNQPIVWHTEGIDITPTIAKLLGKAGAKEAAKKPPGARRRTERRRQAKRPRKFSWTSHIVAATPPAPVCPVVTPPLVPVVTARSSPS